jgi:hypothetical protein
MMASVRAVARLFWRPAAIYSLGFVAFAAAWSVIQAGETLGDGYPMTSAPAIAAIFWNGSILFMGALGIGLALLTAPVHQSLFAFSVPSLRDRILRGVMIIGATVAVAVACVVWWSAGGVDGVGSFAASALFFAVALSTFDPTRSRLQSTVGFVLSAVMVYEVRWAPLLFHMSPVLITIGVLLGAAALIRRELSVDTARMRASAQRPILVYGPFGARRINDAGPNTRDRFFGGRPSSDRLVDWVRAMGYENFGFRKGGWLVFVGGSALIIGAIGCAANSTMMVGYLGMQSVSFAGLRLIGRWPYPTTRRRRADAAFAGGVINSVVYFALAAIVVWVYRGTGVPHFGFVGDATSGRQGPDVIGAAFIWAPLPMWWGVTRPIVKAQRKTDPRTLLGLFGFSMLAFVLVIASLSLLRVAAGGNGLAWAGLAALAGSAVYGTYWLALRRHFRSHDLV